MNVYLKRTVSLLMSAVIFCTVFVSFALLIGAEGIWGGSTAEGFESGSGSKNDPYIIATAEQLAYMADRTAEKETYKGKYFKLKNDIYLNDVDGYDDWETTAPANVWEPIGPSKQNPFSGNFDGNGKTVYGLYISQSVEVGDYYTGLFGYLKGGVVTNLTVDMAYIDVVGGINTGFVSTGPIAGFTFEGKIENCKANAVQKIEHQKDNTFVGGITGKADEYSTLKRVEAAGKLTFAVGDHINGFIGGITGVLSGFSTTDGAIASVEINALGEVGGIVGILGGSGMPGILRNAYNTGSLTGSIRVGGLVGRAGQVAGCIVENCFNVGNITAGDDAYNAGALLAAVRNATTINNCYYLDDTDLPMYNNYTDDVDNLTAENVSAKAEYEFKGMYAVESLGFSEEIWESTVYGYPIFKQIEQGDEETEPETEPVTEPVTDPETDPATDPETDPVTDPETDPVTDPGTEPVTEAPATEAPKADEGSCGGVSLGAVIVLAVASCGMAVAINKKNV